MTAAEAAAELARAEACVEAGDLEAAREIAEAVLAEDANQPAAHNVLGFIAHRQMRLIDAQREFEHACSLAGAGEEVRANLAEVRRQLAELYAAHAAPAADGGASAGTEFSGDLEDLRAGALGADVSPRLLGRLLSNGFDAPLEARLSELPSAASVNERRFLLRFTAHFWDGQGDVFENGPLLGGTTRALALGMLANPNRRPEALLHTHDWFSSRVPLDLPPDAWDQLIARGLLTRDDYAGMMASGSFQAVFDRLHAGYEYSSLVRSHEAYLPGAPDDVPEHGEAIFEPPEGRAFSLVFVDGCKSWYGTKHWLVRVCDRVSVGSHFVFQDYGWFTCFWLPSMVGVLQDHFRLVAHVDDTYAFELVRPLDPATVRERFPDHPAGFGRDAFDDLFLRLGVDAGVRSDVHSMVVLTIQHAAALAYLGLTDEAREHIAGMLGRPEFFPYRRRFIEPALYSPTYTPEGPIRL